MVLYEGYGKPGRAFRGTQLLPESFADYTPAIRDCQRPTGYCVLRYRISKVISQQNVSDHRIQLRLSCVHGDGCIAPSFLKLVSADCQDSKPTTQDRSNKIGRSIPRRVTKASFYTNDKAYYTLEPCRNPRCIVSLECVSL